MSTRPSTDPRGQVLVITAAALVILLGIGALVVDLGFGVLMRRQAQNAVDPGSIAAARFIDDGTGQTIDMTSAWQAACHYARQNEFFPAATSNGNGGTGCVPANDPYGAVLEVIYPPDARAGQFQGHVGMVQVVLTRARETILGSLLGYDALNVSTDAVAARQRGNTNTHSLIALKPDGCGTAKVRGNGTISIYPTPGYTGPGGHVQVNSNCGNTTGDDDCTTSSQGALDINGTAELTAPKVNVHGGCKGHTSQPIGLLDEAASQIGDPLDGLEFPAWDTTLPGGTCGMGGTATAAASSLGCGGGGHAWAFSPDAACPGLPGGHKCVELQPGVYYGGWEIGTKVQVNLQPGIYVIAGGGITIKASGALDSLSDSTTAAPILIYNTDNPLFRTTCPAAGGRKCQANIDLTAQTSLKLAGLLRDQPCPPVTPAVMADPGCPFGGMVIWYDGGGSQAAGSGQVDIEGGSNLFISGTIYAPRAHVDITGNVATNCPIGTQIAAVQIIAWTWDLGGTGDLCMPYDPNLLYQLSLQGLVH
jgi:hypothetical protein